MLLGWPHEGQRSPFPLERMFVEELDAAQCDGAGAAGGVLDVLEVEEVVAQFFLCDPFWGLMVMFRQLAHGLDIHLLSPFGQASEPKLLDHALTQWGHGYTSCT